MKRVLFDVEHPSHVHTFKYLYWQLLKSGWEGLFVTKDREICIYLLEKYNLPFTILNQEQKRLFKILFILKNILKFYSITKRVKPDIIINRASFHSTLIGKVLNIPQISIVNIENSIDSTLLLDYLFTPIFFKKNLGAKHIKYKANTELFYLHKKWFSPNKNIFKFLGIKENNPYAIVRFSPEESQYGSTKKKFSTRQKLKLIKELSKEIQVFISCEEEIPSELKNYQITIPPEKIHDALYFATLYIGEGGTMALESAILGTPAIYINRLNSAGVFIKAEEAKLLYRITKEKEIIKKALEIIKDKKEIYLKRRDEYLKDKIDVTSFMMWVVQNYPKSIKFAKSIDFQERFK